MACASRTTLQSTFRASHRRPAPLLATRVSSCLEPCSSTVSCTRAALVPWRRHRDTTPRQARSSARSHRNSHPASCRLAFRSTASTWQTHSTPTLATTSITTARSRKSSRLAVQLLAARHYLCTAWSSSSVRTTSAGMAMSSPQLSSPVTPDFESVSHGALTLT